MGILYCGHYEEFCDEVDEKIPKELIDCNQQCEQCVASEGGSMGDFDMNSVEPDLEKDEIDFEPDVGAEVLDAEVDEYLKKIQSLQSSDGEESEGNDIEDLEDIDELFGDGIEDIDDSDLDDQFTEGKFKISDETFNNVFELSGIIDKIVEDEKAKKQGQ